MSINSPIRVSGNRGHTTRNLWLQKIITADAGKSAAFIFESKRADCSICFALILNPTSDSLVCQQNQKSWRATLRTDEKIARSKSNDYDHRWTPELFFHDYFFDPVFLE